MKSPTSCVDPVRNVGKAFGELRQKFDKWVAGSVDVADDRTSEHPLLANLRLCRFAPDDKRFLHDCKNCAAEAHKLEIERGTPCYPGASFGYQPDPVLFVGRLSGRAGPRRLPVRLALCGPPVQRQRHQFLPLPDAHSPEPADRTAVCRELSHVSGIVLDVAIGLAFTYLLMAIIVSGLVEVLAGWRKWRGKSLRDGIAGLLDAGDHPLLDQLFKDVFTHGLVADLSSKGLPSYVPSRNFAMALLDVLKPDGSTGTAFSRIQFGIQKLPAGTLKQALSTFVEHAAGDAEALQKRIESWFDDLMDRLTGEYKRHTQAWMIGLALVAAMVLNVDLIFAGAHPLDRPRRAIRHGRRRAAVCRQERSSDCG